MTGAVPYCAAGANKKNPSSLLLLNISVAGPPPMDAFVSNNLFPAISVWISKVALSLEVFTYFVAHKAKEIFPSNGVFFFEINMTGSERQRFNFFMRFKNNQGLTYQLIIAKVNGVIKFASRHRGDAINKTEVPNDFPGYSPNNPDSLFQ